MELVEPSLVSQSRSQTALNSDESAGGQAAGGASNTSNNEVVALVDKFVDAATKDPVRIRRLIASLEDKQQRLLGSVVTISPSASLIIGGSGDSWLQDENSQGSAFASTAHQQPQNSSSSPPNISTSLASVASTSSANNNNNNENSSSQAPQPQSEPAKPPAPNFFASAKMARLEAERNDLLMQVSVLSAQVSAQQEKISELESNPNTNALPVNGGGSAPKKLANGNGVITPTSPLTENGGNDSRNGTLSNGNGTTQHRLDLLSEISTLKVRLAAAENASRDWEAKYVALQKLTTQHIKERDLQLADMRNRLVRQQQQQVPPDAVYEIDRLRRAVDSLLTSNVDKERKIDELQASLVRYRRMFDSAVEDAAFSDTASAKSLNIGRYMGANGQAVPQGMVAPQQPQQIVAPIYSRPSVNSAYAPIGDSVSLTGDGYGSATYPYPRTSSRAEQYSTLNGSISRPPSVLRQGPIPPMQDPMATQVTPLVMHAQNLNSSAQHAEDDSAGELSDVVYDDVGHHNHHPSHHHQQQQQQQLNSRNGPVSRSLRVPRPEDAPQLFWGQPPPQSHQATQPPHFSTSSVTDTVFDENLPSARPKKQASSGRPSPNPTSMDDEQRRVDEAVNEYKQRLDQSVNESTSSSASVAKSATSKFASGLSRFLHFGSKKSAAKTVDAEEIGIYGSSEGNSNFSRGGIRATVAATGTVPRRYVAPTFPSPGSSFQNLTTIPPRMWDSEQIARWLADLGLAQYVPECRRNIRTGDRLLQLSGSDFEKELTMKNSLHIKKLQIAISRLRAIASGTSPADAEHPSSRLHSALVLRWLDDIGLPQLKDVFVECQIDGAVLNMLSLEDLPQLRITSRLHALSIRWGITALRAANFDLNRFIRRPPLADGSDRVGNYTADGGNRSSTGESREEGRVEEPPSRVLFWTCHRVMDWLRSVDLAEYAANVRGSGLHGAVMLLESTFTAESLAAILQIPSNRSLLRRHLAQKFDQLVGQAAAEAKSATGQSEVLLPSTKLKIKKSSSKSIFSSSSKHVASTPPLTIDVFAGSSNSSLNASLLSSPSVDGKILSNLVGTSAASTSSGNSSKRNSPPVGNVAEANSSGGTTSGGDSMTSSTHTTVQPPQENGKSSNNNNTSNLNLNNNNDEEHGNIEMKIVAF